MTQHPSSFRDPSGFVFEVEGVVYRQVNQMYQTHYNKLMSSGLYEHLVSQQLLLPHTEVPSQLSPIPSTCFKILLPKQLPQLSYAYEWSVGMLKDAALHTLQIQKLALEYGMTLKDASHFNIQFEKGKPVFIDTLSFEVYQQDKPWQGYGQFCRHFLAPLALMCYQDIGLNQLLAQYLDGIPLHLATSLLPWRARFNSGLFFHLFLHQSTIKKYQNKPTATAYLTQKAHLRVLEHLSNTIRQLNITPIKSTWNHYYQANVPDEYLAEKEQFVRSLLSVIKPPSIADLGANDGFFSLLAAEYTPACWAIDSDPWCIEALYQKLKNHTKISVLPLVIDLANPSPAIGWNNQERLSLLQRLQADTALILAIVHHLRITYQIPFQQLAALLQNKFQHIIIEFIPKTDPKVTLLLQNRADVFDDYSEQKFEAMFGQYFFIHKKEKLFSAGRTLYWMQKHAQ